MGLYGNASKATTNTSNELLIINRSIGEKLYPATEETSVVMDPENHINNTKNGASPSSPHSCSCGPNCGPDKCDGRKSTSLVAWDDNRTKIFLLLIMAFAVWLLIYIPISVTLNSSSTGDHDEHVPMSMTLNSSSTGEHHKHIHEHNQVHEHNHDHHHHG